MTTEPLKALFALLETEEDDFAFLAQRFGIDPATDLRNCDLTNVDFGNLTTNILDLTGSDIEGANLSNVRCKQIIGVEYGANKPTSSLKNATHELVLSHSLFNAAILAVSSYENGSDWIIDWILSHRDHSKPVLAFYDTVAEQDILTKRLCANFGKVTPVILGRTKFLWFYSNSRMVTFELDATSLEANFFGILRYDETPNDKGGNSYLTNLASVNRIRSSSLERGSFDRKRRAFARRLVEELRGANDAVVLFSGYPPVSKRLFRDILKMYDRQLKLIFLCPSSLRRLQSEGGGAAWQRLVVPADSVDQPKVRYKDITTLSRRIETAARGTISMGPDFERRLASLVGMPISLLKGRILDRMTDVRAMLPVTGLAFKDIAL